MTNALSPVTDQSWSVDVAGLTVELPIVAIKPDFAISLMMVIDLVRAAGGMVVGIGVILTEARDWQETLGEDATLIRSLAHIPQFTQNDGTWSPIPQTFL